MNYEQKYKEALERARQVHTTNVDENKKSTEYIFPELKESENERTRKELVDFINSHLAGFPQCEKYIAWIEKQGEQKPSWTEDEEKNFNVCLGYIPDESLKRWLIEQWRNSYDKNN